MDYFAFGGILMDEELVSSFYKEHEALSKKWELRGPLHSTKIRGRRNHFSWLASDRGKEEEFFHDLEQSILKLPLIGNACVVDRPGYVKRYASLYDQPWLLCKTAYAILIERSAKFARSRNQKLRIFYEEAGKKEDSDLEEYTKLLRQSGMPFAKDSSANYGSLTAEEFQDIIIGEPQRITKKVPMIQFADLCLYPMAKAGYDRMYSPYQKMIENGQVIDCHLAVADRQTLGVKYSCFD